MNQIIEMHQQSSVLYNHYKKGVAQDWTESQWIAEILLHEIFALGTCSQRWLLDRVGRLAFPFSMSEPNNIGERLSILVQQGDLILGTGGVLAPSPLRAVVLPEQSVLLVGGAPTSRLQQELGTTIEWVGDIRRFCNWSSELQETIQERNGLTLNLKQWSGVSKVPNANSAYISECEHLVQHGEVSASLDAIMGTNFIQCYAPTLQGTQHQKWESTVLFQEPFSLLRAQQPGGWWRYVIAKKQTGQAIQWFTLTSDEARRLMYALERESRQTTAMVLSQYDSHHHILELHNMLPNAEYRYLIACAKETLSHAFPKRYLLASPAAYQVVSLLQEKLGVNTITTDLSSQK